MQVARLPLQDDRAYALHRNRAVAARCRTLGVWSELWASSLTKWYEHFQRDPVSCVARLFMHHDSIWLQTQRLVANSASIFAGITNRRAVRAPVARRYEPGIEAARANVRMQIRRITPA